MDQRFLKCIGFEQITGLSAVKLLTVPSDPTTGRKAAIAIVHAEAQAVRWRQDGTAPSATVGMRLLVGGELEIDTQLDIIQFIEETASAKLNVSYYV